MLNIFLVFIVGVLPAMLIGMIMVAIVLGWDWLLMAIVDACYRIHLQQAHVPAPGEVAPEGRAATATSVPA